MKTNIKIRLFVLLSLLTIFCLTSKKTTTRRDDGIVAANTSDYKQFKKVSF